MSELRGSLRGLLEGGGSGERPVMIGLAAAALWIAAVLLFWLLGPEGSGRTSGAGWMLRAAGLISPLALIWMAVSLARTIAALRAEADDLRAELARVQDAAASPVGRPREVPPAARPVQTSRAPARPGAAARPQADARQSALPLEDDEPPAAISPIDLLRALNFPDGPDDVEAIRALRAALADHDTMRLIRAAQDVVTLLAQAGVYMDDLAPRPAPAPLWRGFAEGARGPQMAALAGVDDEAALDRATNLLRGDEIFRDAAHHFMRQFDRMLTRMAPELEDEFLGAMTETRSGRAFVLLGQSSGIFSSGT